MASLLNMSGGSLLKKGLPYDAEIEYLESTGTQWIEIPMPKGEIISFEIEFNSPKYFYICGSLHTSSAIYPSFFIDGNNRIYITDIATSSRIILNYGFIEDTDLLLTYQNGILTTNGAQKYTNLFVSADYYRVFYLFGAKIDDGRRLLANGVKIKKFKVETVNGSINLIPVRVGNVGYMYDKVSGQLFGNAGTGNFILGPDK